MITTGARLEKEKSKSTEVFDMEYPMKTCEKLPDYPLAVYFAVGGLVDKMPVICGGAYSKNSFKSTNECYILKDKIQWIKLASLDSIRNVRETAGPGCVTINDGKSLWITGFILNLSKNFALNNGLPKKQVEEVIMLLN